MKEWKRGDLELAKHLSLLCPYSLDLDNIDIAKKINKKKTVKLPVGLNYNHKSEIGITRLTKNINLTSIRSVEAD